MPSKNENLKTDDVTEWILTGPIIVACQWNTETKNREIGYETLRTQRVPEKC